MPRSCATCTRCLHGSIWASTVSCATCKPTVGWQMMAWLLHMDRQLSGTGWPIELQHVSPDRVFGQIGHDLSSFAHDGVSGARFRIAPTHLRLTGVRALTPSAVAFLAAALRQSPEGAAMLDTALTEAAGEVSPGATELAGDDLADEPFAMGLDAWQYGRGVLLPDETMHALVWTWAYPMRCCRPSSRNGSNWRAKHTRSARPSASRAPTSRAGAMTVTCRTTCSACGDSRQAPPLPTN